MINFRFHLVSITAIFLALAAGIAVGAAVVDRASVELLRTQLDEVEARREATNARNDELKLEVDQWALFAEQAGNRLLDGHLAGVEGGAPVLVVAVDGVERAHVTALDAALIAAGASSQGIVWLSPEWSLESAESADQLAAALGIGTSLSPETIRRAAIARLGRALLDGDPADLLVSLQASAFVEHVSAEDGPALAAVPSADATLILVSGPGAVVSDRMLALPLVSAMAGTGESFIVAQPGRPAADEGDPSGFVGAVRGDAELAAQLTTVDSLDDYRGEVAAVLSVEALLAGITGHYGLGAGAERILPELPAPPADQ